MKKFSLFFACFLVLVFLIGSVSVCAAEKIEVKKVAAVLVGPINDHSWNESAYHALMGLKEEGYTVAYVEGVYEPVNIVPALRKYANAGYDVVIGHGFQALEGINEVAKDFPNVYFIADTGYLKEDSPTNLAVADIRDDETGYLEGVLAALMTRTNKVGFISGLDVGELHRNAYGFELGLKSVNPKIEFYKVYTGDFHDTEGARERALSLIADGVDVINVIGNGVSYGAISACVDKGVWVTGNTWDIRPFAPEVALTTGLFNWLPIWKQIIKDIEAGTLEPKVYWATLANGGHVMTPLNPKIPTEISRQIEALKEKIISGELVIPPE